ncbi:MAG: LytTR family DNA-binding domain-containing protein [Anaerorhabdus sp.]
MSLSLHQWVSLIVNDFFTWYIINKYLIEKGSKYTMRIAICEDNEKELAQIEALLTRYKNEFKVSLTYTTFHNGISLLDSLSKQTFDLLLLDIVMPGLSGITVAKEIRTRDQNVKIIFLTSSSEFAVESYRVHATDYLLKPITSDILFPVLDDLYLNQNENEPVLTIKSDGSLFILPYSQIIYLEVMNRRVRFYLTNGTIREIFGYLSDFEEELLSCISFVKTHRSFIVNFKHVREISSDGIKTDTGKIIPVSRNAYAQTKIAFAKYLFNEKEVF